MAPPGYDDGGYGDVRGDHKVQSERGWRSVPITGESGGYAGEKEGVAGY